MHSAAAFVPAALALAAVSVVSTVPPPPGAAGRFIPARARAVTLLRASSFPHSAGEGKLGQFFAVSVVTGVCTLAWCINRLPPPLHQPSIQPHDSPALHGHGAHWAVFAPGFHRVYSMVGMRTGGFGLRFEG